MADRKEVLHDTSVAGNVAAGTAGAGFGAAKLRDEFKTQYPKKFDHAVAHGANTAIKHGVKGEKLSRLVHVAQVGRPGFKTLAAGTAAGALAAGAHNLSQHEQRKSAKVSKSAFGVELGYVSKADHREKHELRERLHAAAHPAPVKRTNVDSTALRSLGYQRQTRRLAVEMNSRPGEPYTYRVPPKRAKAVIDAPSKGHAYATQIRGKYEREPKVRVSDRVRLFANPDGQVSKALEETGLRGTRRASLDPLRERARDLHERAGTSGNRYVARRAGQIGTYRPRPRSGVLPGEPDGERVRLARQKKLHTMNNRMLSRKPTSLPKFVVRAGLTKSAFGVEL